MKKSVIFICFLSFVFASLCAEKFDNLSIEGRWSYSFSFDNSSYGVVDYLSFHSPCCFRNYHEERSKNRFSPRGYASPPVRFAQEVCFYQYSESHSDDSVAQAATELAESIVNLTDSILRLTVSGYNSPPPHSPPPHSPPPHFRR